MAQLKHYHPFVITLFIFTLVGLNTIFSHPFLHLFFLLVSWFYMRSFPSISLQKQIRMNLFFMLLTCITNPIFQGRGIYILCYIGNRAITLEALCYGLDFGCMLAGTMNLLKVYSYIIHTDQTLYLITRISKNAAIIFSLSLQQFQRLRHQYEEVKIARSLLYQPTSWLTKAKESTDIVSSLITWLMETSVDTSISMKSRGYGNEKRTHYTKYTIESRDQIFLLVNYIMILLSIYASFGIKFWWYPSFYQQISILHVSIFSIGLCIFCAIPLYLSRKEAVLWDDLTSI